MDSNEMSLGSAISKTVKFSMPYVDTLFNGKKAIIYIGLQTDIDVEWIKKATLNIVKTIKKENLLCFECYDSFYFCEKTFTTNLKGLQKIKTIVNDQCTKLGIFYVNNIEDISYNVDFLNGLTIREAFGYLASYLGKNAHFNENDELEFIWYTECGYEIGPDRYSSPLDVVEQDTTINSLTCVTKKSIIDENGNQEQIDETLVSGDGFGIVFSCLGMTQDRLNILFNRIKGFSYRSCSLNLLISYPELEVGDIVKINDLDGNIYYVPIMDENSKCDGGYQSVIQSFSKTENDYEFKGSLATQIERNYQEYASFKQVIAEDIKSFNGEFIKVNTDILSVNKELTAIKANIGDLNVDELAAKVATIETSYVNKQFVNENYVGIQYANQTYAIKSDVNELNADVAKINTLLSGSVTAGSTQTIVLNAENTTIANALIKSANIESVNANIINSGTLNTNLVHIQSQDGGIKLNGNTQQFLDKNNKVRVQIGRDAQNNFNFLVVGEDGTTAIFNENGITSKAVPDGLIVDQMVSNGANIQGSKLDIDSVITEVNGATTTIKSSKIYFDEKKQTLDVAFNTMSNTVTETTNVVETANTNANNALTKANTALTDSASAKTTANSAKSVADGAKTTADSANTKATNASTNASNALSKANQLETKVATVENTVKSQSTQISTAQGQISTLITDVTQAKKDITTVTGDVTTAKANISTLTNNYSSVKQTVDGLSTTVGSHTSSIANINTVANNALNTANSKAKVFTATPTTPYKIGDLWVQGSTGLIMKCKVARASGSYVASDWEKADKYTDDATANKVRTDLTASIKTVTDKQATFQTTINSITSRVSSTETNITTLTTTANTALSNANNAKAYTDSVRNNYGYLYKTSIIINGESNKYYPVILRGGNQNVMRELFIVRNYAEQAPDDWYTSTHKGGLTLKIKCNYGGWGGISYSWYIHDFEQTYTPTFGGKAGNISGMFFYIYLRGGGTTGAKYWIYSDQPIVNTYMGGSSPQICYNSEQIGYSIGNGTAQNPQFKFNAPAPITTQDTEMIKKKKYDSLAETNYTEITNTKSTVATHTTQLNNITSRVSTTETNITTINNNVTSLTTRMSTAEQKITDSAIVNTVTKSSSWTTLNTKATDAQTKANNLVDLTTIKDTRSANNNPQWYFTNYPYKTVREFKYCTTVGVSGEGTYGTLETTTSWGSSSGGYPVQLFYPNNSQNIYRRVGTSTAAWGAWTKVAGTHNAISIINQTAESIKIQANKIALEGLVTANSRFKILTDGSMEAVNGKFSGNINATSGSIAGFTLSSSRMSSSSTKTFNFTQSDKDNIMNIIMSGRTPTTAELQRLDINGNGKIDSADYMLVEKIINAGNRVSTSFNIYPKFESSNYNEGVFNVSVSGFATTKITNTGGLYSSQATINSLTVNDATLNELHVNMANGSCDIGDQGIELYGNTPFIDFHHGNDAVDYTSRLISLNRGEICSLGDFKMNGASKLRFYSDQQIYGDYYGSSHNLYVNAPSGYLALYSHGNAVYADLRYVDSNWSKGKFYASGGGTALGGSSTDQRWYRLYARNACNTSSDRRLKENIEYMGNPKSNYYRSVNQTNVYEELFKQLKPSSFTMKSDKANRVRFGFIAQDVIEAINVVGLSIDDVDFVSLPETENSEDNMYGLVYEEFIALNTHMIQKNIAKIDDVNIHLSDHDKEIQELRNENARLQQELRNTQSKLDAFINGSFELKTVTREVA